MDPDDQDSYKLNHFLIGTAGKFTLSGTFSDADMSLRKQWRKAQRLADHLR